MVGRCDLALDDVTQHNIRQVKKINQIVFPVFYTDKFYTDILKLGQLAKIAYFNDMVVGTVCCRLDLSGSERRMYIMTLGCLPTFRRFGVGRMMLEYVLKMCRKFDCVNVYLHVQINNDVAIEFYKNFGFTIRETKEKYYRRIEPSDAFVLQRDLNEDSGGVEKGSGTGGATGTA